MISYMKPYGTVQPEWFIFSQLHFLSQRGKLLVFAASVFHLNCLLLSQRCE